jgi:hypothetical protein
VKNERCRWCVLKTGSVINTVLIGMDVQSSVREDSKSRMRMGVTDLNRL